MHSLMKQPVHFNGDTQANKNVEGNGRLPSISKTHIG